ncbi:MAG TPA: hypothetical protein VEH27_03680 [Methylomirabilota bacterium]|nr:hypothetical protein [Methylomirabilota bacterium]
MKLGTLLLLTILPAFIGAGCHVNIGSEHHQSRHSPAVRKGSELNEYELLGLRADASFETEVEKALAAAKDLRIKPGSTVMLIKSGRSLPDQKMVQALEGNYQVVTFTGIPTEAGFKAEAETPFSKGIRLAAARAGAETIICYWEKLETTTQELPTSIVSWVPVLDLTLPHESQSLRLTAKLAVIDVRSGNWALFTTQPHERKGLRTASGKEHNDQTHIEALRGTAYNAAAAEIQRRYSK